MKRQFALPSAKNKIISLISSEAMGRLLTERQDCRCIFEDQKMSDFLAMCRRFGFVSTRVGLLRA